MVAVVASYRQLVRAYPTGGGDYEVASKNIGRSAGVVVASALLVDYVMTVAVSVSSGVDNIISAFPSLNSDRVLMAVGFVVVLAAVNLRGIREAGLGLRRADLPVHDRRLPDDHHRPGPARRRRRGRWPRARTTACTCSPATARPACWCWVSSCLRAFSSGCTALTGVEAIANGVPAFQRRRRRTRRRRC